MTLLVTMRSNNPIFSGCNSTWTARLFLITVLLLSAKPSLAEISPSILNDVASAWKRREASTTTFDCQFETRFFTAAKSSAYSDLKGHRILLPHEDTTVQHNVRLRVSGNKFGRYEFSGPQLIQETQKFEQRPFVAVFSGDEEIHYFDSDKDASKFDFYGTAFIRHVEHLPEIDVLNDLMPLYSAYRPSAWLQARHLVLDKAHSLQEIAVREAKCLFLRFNHFSGFFDMYLDLQNEFIPVRFQTTRGHGNRDLGVRCDMWFESKGSGIYLPRSWKTTIYQVNGGVLHEYDSSVTNFSANVAIPDSVFNFQIPVGAVVTNSVTDECYISLKNGEKRQIMPGEDVTIHQYPKLLATRSPILTPSGKHWLLWANIVAAVVIVSLLFYRRMKSRVS